MPSWSSRRGSRRSSAGTARRYLTSMTEPLLPGGDDRTFVCRLHGRGGEAPAVHPRRVVTADPPIAILRPECCPLGAVRAVVKAWRGCIGGTDAVMAGLV